MYNAFPLLPKAWVLQFCCSALLIASLPRIHCYNWQINAKNLPDRSMAESETQHQWVNYSIKEIKGLIEARITSHPCKVC